MRRLAAVTVAFEGMLAKEKNREIRSAPFPWATAAHVIRGPFSVQLVFGRFDDVNVSAPTGISSVIVVMSAESLASERRMVLFEEAMSILSTKEQKMVCGYHLERKSMEELAGDVGYCSAGSAKKAKCLAMGKMRRYIATNGFRPDGHDYPMAA